MYKTGFKMLKTPRMLKNHAMNVKVLNMWSNMQS